MECGILAVFIRLREVLHDSLKYGINKLSIRGCNEVFCEMTIAVSSDGTGYGD